MTRVDRRPPPPICEHCGWLVRHVQTYGPTGISQSHWEHVSESAPEHRASVNPIWKEKR